MKKQKLKDIKRVDEFYYALRNEVQELFDGYVNCGIFDGLSTEQKKDILGFGNNVLSNVYNPIQKRYTQQVKKKYEKLLKQSDDLVGKYIKEVEDVRKQASILIERLSRSIQPKFHIGQEVWALGVLHPNSIDSFIIREICYCAGYGLYYKTDLGVSLYEYYFHIFTSREEAEVALKTMLEADTNESSTDK